MRELTVLPLIPSSINVGPLRGFAWRVESNLPLEKSGYGSDLRRGNGPTPLPVVNVTFTSSLLTALAPATANYNSIHWWARRRQLPGNESSWCVLVITARQATHADNHHKDINDVTTGKLLR